MRDTRELIAVTTASDRALAESHQAFAEFVERFQDMAFGCAYAVPNDFYLAEDADLRRDAAASSRGAHLKQTGTTSFPATLVFLQKQFI